MEKLFEFLKKKIFVSFFGNNFIVSSLIFYVIYSTNEKIKLMHLKNCEKLS